MSVDGVILDPLLVSLLLHQLPLLRCLLLSVSDLGQNVWRGLCITELTLIANVVGGVDNDWVGRESIEIPHRKMSSPVLPVEKEQSKIEIII